MAEVERQLNARNEALAENKLTQEDMQVLIVSAINSVDGVSDYSKADAIVEAQQELSRLSTIKSKEGGKIGPEDAKTLVNEASSIPPLHHPSPHPSPLTPPPPPLTSHLSPLTPHPSHLTPHPSPLTAGR